MGGITSPNADAVLHRAGSVLWKMDGSKVELLGLREVPSSGVGEEVLGTGIKDAALLVARPYGNTARHDIRHPDHDNSQ